LTLSLLWTLLHANEIALTEDNQIEDDLSTLKARWLARWGSTEAMAAGAIVVSIEKEPRMPLRKPSSLLNLCHAMSTAFVCLAAAIGAMAFESVAAAQTPVDDPFAVEAQDSGMLLHNLRETVQITFCGRGVIHVAAKPAAEADPMHAPEPWISVPCVPARTTAGLAAGTVGTDELHVSANLKTGALRFQDAEGKVLLQESDLQPRRYQPTVSGDRAAYSVSDRFSPELLEGLYGLGQHQSGVFNYRCSVVELAQANSDIAVPLLLSTNGYGLLWNTASRAFFDDRFSRELKLTAEVADGVDYYFFYGPSMDSIIQHYRMLTGQAPLLPKWAYGFMQSKDRYTSAQQLLDITAHYRSQHVPLDSIVQDWFWWKRQGDAEFSDAYLEPHPDVVGALQTLHQEHAHAIISAWAVLDPTSDAYKTLAEKHLLIPGTPDYDPTNPEARDFYWKHLVGKLFDQGWDGFWLDSSEPEIWGGENDGALEGKQLAIGPGARYLNIFPLMHSGNVYEHWRKANAAKRVFLLTRSAFAGQQRYGTVEWSGDIFGTFPVLRRQIAAGMNFALSGMPYWTTDIAGYTSPYANEPANPEYQELYTRWFEFGTFCPIMRTHGHRSANEVFSYGPQTPTLIAYDKLRSRLLPYIYSLAWKVTNEGYTLMRPLVMDWSADTVVRSIDDQYMFGPSLLVNPVTVAGATQRTVYLPPAPSWYDFWTGESLRGGQFVQASAPLNRIPLYVPAGAILPLGPENEYVDQHPDETTEVRIYPGANGSFTLYDDAGDSYRYERGDHATISLNWDDTTKILSFGKREGTYPGMSQTRKFHVLLAAKGVGFGSVTTAKFVDVQYDGVAQKVSLK
jgi:alpha-D-xyloside xylohydrolase